MQRIWAGLLSENVCSQHSTGTIELTPLMASNTEVVKKGFLFSVKALRNLTKQLVM